MLAVKSQIYHLSPAERSRWPKTPKLRAPSQAQEWHVNAGFLSLTEVPDRGTIVQGDALGDESDLEATHHSP